MLQGECSGLAGFGLGHAIGSSGDDKGKESSSSYGNGGSGGSSGGHGGGGNGDTSYAGAGGFGAGNDWNSTENSSTETGAMDDEYEDSAAGRIRVDAFVAVGLAAAWLVGGL